MQSKIERDLIRKLRSIGVSGGITTATAPVQYEGAIGGRYLYFRSRGDRWTFDVAETAETVFDSPLFSVDGNYGEEFDASHMPIDIALWLVLDCSSQYIWQNKIAKLSAHKQLRELLGILWGAYRRWKIDRSLVKEKRKVDGK